MTDKPKALELIENLEYYNEGWLYNGGALLCAAELRRLHTENQKLHRIVQATVGQAFYEDDYHKLKEVNQALVEALERLAKLGNGNQYGNSEGNQIAQVALSKAKEST